MADFTPTPEAKSRVSKAISAAKSLDQAADDAIAAFVEAEGLTIESDLPDTYEDRIRDWRLVGPWKEA